MTPENPPQDTNPFLSPHFAPISRALRFFAFAFTAAISYPNFCLAHRLSGFQQIFHDMLGNKPLPALTDFVLNHSTLFFVVAIALPLAALAMVFIGRLERVLYIYGVIVLLVFIQFYFLWNAVLIPLTGIIQGMQGNG